MFDTFWPDEVEEWSEVAEALRIEEFLERMSAAQYGQMIPDEEGKVAESKKKMVESLDDERRILMGLKTRVQMLADKTRSWIEAKKKAKMEKESREAKEERK